MADIKKRDFMKFASYTAIAGIGGLLVACGDDNKPAAGASTSTEGNAAAGNAMTDATSAPVQTVNSATEPLKVAFVYIGPVGDGGWTYSHDQGRKHIEEVFGDKIQTTFVENVKEGADAERVFRDLVDQGNKLIFGCTFGYMESILRVAADNPDIFFEHCTGYQTAANVRVYDHKLYEAAYQAGITAAHMTKSKIIGFVGTYPIPEVLRNVNAFTLGARSVDPDIVVKVVWVHSWYNPTEEGNAANALFNGGADVVLQNTDSSAVLQATAKAGHLGFGWDSDMSKYAPNAHLASCVLNWGGYYEKAVNEVLSNQWKTESTQWGSKEGLVEFANISNKVSSDAKKQLEEVQAGLKDGTLHIFEGPLNDNSGKERLAAGTVADGAWLANVDFLVEGIDGTI